MTLRVEREAEKWIGGEETSGVHFCNTEAAGTRCDSGIRRKGWFGDMTRGHAPSICRWGTRQCHKEWSGAFCCGRTEDRRGDHARPDVGWGSHKDKLVGCFPSCMFPHSTTLIPHKIPY